MAGALPRLKQGPASYTAGGLILGGQLVCPNSATAGDVLIKVMPTAGPPTNTGPLGIAATDASTGQYPEGTPSSPAGWPGDSSNANQDQLLDISILNYTVAVYNQADMYVNYDGTAVNFGEKLTWSSNTAGSVMAYTGTDPKLIVGYCSNPGGVPATAGVYRAFIRV